MADRPDAAQIRAWSKLDFDEFDYPEPASGPDPLDELILRAVAWFENVTGRSFAQTDDTQESYLGPTDSNETTNDEILAREAVQMLVEWRVVRGSSDAVETAGDIDLITSLTAGSYSETRRATPWGLSMLHPWPALNDLLNSLLTPTKGTALLGGAPSVVSVEPDWDVGREIIDAKKREADAHDMRPGGVIGWGTW